MAQFSSVDRRSARAALVVAGTLALVFLAQMEREKGGRLPMTFNVLWVGAAAVTGLMFSPAGRAHPAVFETGGPTPDQQWTSNLRRAAAWLLPLALVPILEIRRIGYDPAIWLMNGALVIGLCTAPYFRLVSGTVVGGVVLNMCALMLLWLPAVHWMLGEVARMRSEGTGTHADSFALHAFFAPEFRHLLYGLCVAVLLLYCPIMLALGRRRFRRGQGAVDQAGPGESVA